MPPVAVLIIDLQNDVLDECTGTAAVLEQTAILVARARTAGAPVIFVQHEDPWLIADTDGWQLHAGLDVRPGDPRVRKRYRDAFADTELSAILADLGSRHLVIAGAQSDFCVRTTAQRAASLGFDLTLVSDAHTTADADLGDERLSAAQIVAHTNAYFENFTAPGITAGTATAATVAL